MNPLTTRDALTIFWKGEEIAGLLAYGYWRGAMQPAIELPSGWPPDTEFRDHWLVNWQDGDQEWRVLIWTIRLAEWPVSDQWRAAIERTLPTFLDAGARIAWFGVEGHFVDPPALFDPAEMSGGVWAVLTRDGGLQIAADVDGAFESLSDRELTRLRMYL